MALVLKGFGVLYTLNFVFHQAFAVWHFFRRDTGALILVCHGLKVGTIAFPGISGTGDGYKPHNRHSKSVVLNTIVRLFERGALNACNYLCVCTSSLL